MDIDLSLLTSELIRIGTYQGWPGQDIHSKPLKPSAIDLAKAGFYYSGLEDEVRCFCCGLVVGDWEGHHNPVVVHATRNPQCPFIAHGDSGNKPVYVPAEPAYSVIKAMLREAGQKVASTASGTSYSASNLIADTLRSLYGDSMVRCSSPRVGSRASSANRSGSNSPRTLQPAGYRPSRNEGQSGDRGTGRRPPAVSGTPPPRRSSTSDAKDANPTASSAKPNLNRASSCVQPRRSSRSSETIANRQTSNPGIDNAEYQASEDARFATFKEWRGIRGATAREFAQAGFIYIGQPDRVQCVFCNGILRNWNDNDHPLDEHRKHFPNCTFASEDMSGISVAKPRHPKYSMEPSRLTSFRGWDMSKTPTPQELARAGFFYVGHGDSVKCFFCDGGLRNWETTDDPWREHARWFPSCHYVIQSKGREFIDTVLGATNLTEYQTASVDETQLKIVARSAAAAAAAQREVDPREVTARMDSPIVKTVLNMDIPKKLVQKAIKQRLAENGEDFSSAEALLEAVFSLDPNTDVKDAEEVTHMGEVKPRENTSSTSSVGDSDDSMRLMEENRKLKEERLCKICMDEDVCVAFLPCGHLVCCSTCAPALNQCPICRKQVRGTARIFMS